MNKWIFFLIIHLPLTLSAQHILELNENKNEFILGGKFLSILEDKNGKLTLDEILNNPDIHSQFQQNREAIPYNKNFQSVYWVKFIVKNNFSNKENFFIESFAPHTKDLKLFICDSLHCNQHESGVNKRFYDREYINKNLIFDLSINKGETRTIFVRVHSDNYSSFDFRIKTINFFTFYNTNEYFFLGLYYGILLIMALYNFLLYISTREKVYIFYIMYVFSGMLTTLADDCLGYQFIWYNHTYINSILGDHIAQLLLLMTFILYAREFLHLKERLPHFDKIVLSVTLLYLAYYGLRLTILPLSWFFRGLYLIPFVMVYIAAVKSFFSGYKPARFFIVGYTFIFISIIIIKLRSNGSIEGNLFTVYSLNYGLVLEIIVLSFALADRIRYFKKEKEDALLEKNKAQELIIDQLKINEELKDKVNKELEMKVNERTEELFAKNTELKEMNEKLKEMTELANKMSLKVDIDNWDLQKRVIEEKRARFLGKEISYDEFQKLFPDELSCQRYLYDLKWGQGFICKKCRKSNFTEEQNSFTRKCSNCFYVESATANTLFHGVKFPLNKAFYIAYESLIKNERLTLDQLSETIDLRKNTCWKFRKKINTALEKLTSKERQSIKNLEDAISLPIKEVVEKRKKQVS
ncbi:MAG: 7TM diverse intracellular signaling domain-containing protein [Cytophagaceae bacterium]